MLGLRGSDLVAAQMEPGPRWLDVVTGVWKAGAAALPVDHRLPASEVRRLLARARPTAILDGGRLWRAPDGVPVADGVRLVMATSGTSADPKLVELTERALSAGLSASATRIGAEPGDRWLCCLPVAHMGGMLVVLRGVVQGAKVEVHPGFDVEAFAAATAAGARFTSLVPTALRRLLDANVDLRGYRAILVGGARADPSLVARARAAGANVVRTYGMTETCGGCVYEGAPLRGTEVRIEPADGQIMLRGHMLMSGYRLDPEATAAAFDADGWLRTRDAGSLEGGRLLVDGRLDDVIVSGGEKVWPGRVEDAIRTHPGVADVLVQGRPDPEWGQRVVAMVVPADSSAPPTLEALRGHVASEIPRFAAPVELVLVADLPRSPAGTSLGRSEMREEPPLS